MYKSLTTIATRSDNTVHYIRTPYTRKFSLSFSAMKHAIDSALSCVARYMLNTDDTYHLDYAMFWLCEAYVNASLIMKGSKMKTVSVTYDVHRQLAMRLDIGLTPYDALVNFSKDIARMNYETLSAMQSDVACASELKSLVYLSVIKVLRDTMELHYIDLVADSPYWQGGTDSICFYFVPTKFNEYASAIIYEFQKQTVLRAMDTAMVEIGLFI